MRVTHSAPPDQEMEHALFGKKKPIAKTPTATTEDVGAKTMFQKAVTDLAAVAGQANTFPTDWGKIVNQFNTAQRWYQKWQASRNGVNN